MMKDQLISFEIAKLAKEKGFEIPTCNFVNIKEPDRIVTCGAFNHNYLSHGNVTVSLPTQSLLAKWLREKHDLHVIIEPLSNINFKYRFLSIPHIHNTRYGFKTYEDALEDAFETALNSYNINS